MEGGERRQTAVKTWGFRETEREADDVRTGERESPTERTDDDRDRRVRVSRVFN